MSPPGSSSRSTPPQTTLYVGNLAPSVTEALLLAKFSTVGAVSSVKIRHNRKAQHYTGCAFVQFRRTEDATRALEIFNSSSLCGRPVRIMWAEGGSLPPEASVGVLVRGLNTEIDSKALYDTFSTFGIIHEHKVFRGYGCGFVQFDSEEQVNECIAKTVGWELAGLTAVKLFTNVQVRNFGNRLNGSTLRDMFGQYGAIHEYRVVSNSGSSNGYAYVTFNKLESAARAVVALNGKDFGDGVKISVVSALQPTHPSAEGTVKTRSKNEVAKVKEPDSGEVNPIANLYVVVMDGLISNERLRNLFSPFGTIKSVRVLVGKGNKRAGFVCFGSKEEATRALNEMNGKIVGEAPISVTYAVTKKTSKPEQNKAAKVERKRDLAALNDNPIGIYITGLNAAIREADLRGIFSCSGRIVECGVGLDDSGNSKGFGFVQFENEEAVENCLEKVKSWVLSGSTLSVTKLYTNVHVFNFGYRLTFASMRELFGQYGDIIVYRVVTKIGKCNGFGYVTFKKLKSAAYAVAELNGKDLGEGLKLKVESAPCPPSDRVKSFMFESDRCPYSVKPSKPDVGVNLYIKIMEPTLTKERLLELFSPFGPITSVKVLRGKAKDGECTGFVCFAAGEEATKAIDEMNGKVIGNGPLAVTPAIVKDAKSVSGSKTEPTAKMPAKSVLDPEQKRALAERLYLVVKQLNASMAGSITAKLLDLDNLTQLMTQPVALKAKVDETVVALLLNREQHLQQIESAPAGSAAA